MIRKSKCKPCPSKGKKRKRPKKLRPGRLDAAGMKALRDAVRCRGANGDPLLDNRNGSDIRRVRKRASNAEAEVTDEKVVQLAGKYPLHPSSNSWDIEDFKAAIREAYDVGRRDGLEEAAKKCESERKCNEKIAGVRQSVWDQAAVSAFTQAAYAIRQLTDAASISSSANSVEGKKE